MPWCLAWIGFRNLDVAIQAITCKTACDGCRAVTARLCSLCLKLRSGRLFALSIKVIRELSTIAVVKQMADPLSVAASVLAIIGACTTGFKTIRWTLAAPHEMKKLNIELEQLRTVIRDVRKIEAANVMLSRALIESLDFAHSKVKEVRAFIDGHLSQAANATIKVRLEFLFRGRGRMKGLIRDVSTIKSQLLNHVDVSTL